MKFGADAIKLVDPEIPEPPRIPTVEEYGPGFIARATAAGLKRSTITMYSTNLTHHIYPVLGKLALDQVNYKALADFLSGKAQTKYSTARFRKPFADEEEEKARPKGKERNYSRDTIRLMAMTMRSLMSEAVKDQIVQINPVVGLSRFYRKKRKDREGNRSGVYTADELHRIEDQLAARNPEYYEFSLAMSREGMRIGEAMALTVHDIDWSRHHRQESPCWNGGSRRQRQDGLIGPRDRVLVDGSPGGAGSHAQDGGSSGLRKGHLRRRIFSASLRGGTSITAGFSGRGITPRSSPKSGRDLRIR